MRFLVWSISREALPPEQALSLITAKRKWVSGQLQVSLAGRSSYRS